MTLTPPDLHRAYTKVVLQMIDEDEPTLRSYAASLLRVSAGATVLDVGSGPGSTVDAVQRTGARIICLDRDPSMLAAIGAAAPRVRGRAEMLPVLEGAVDAVLCAGVLHSIDPDALAWTLAELLRVVRPGGRVVVVNKGLAPWRWATSWYGEMRAQLGDDACDFPPLTLLPAQARTVSVRWFAGDCFYALVYER